MSPRLANASDLDTIVRLTGEAYAPYTALLGAPPLPVTEDYAPRIAAGEVWLLRPGDALVGLLVLERHPDHAMIYSVAVAPGHQGEGYGSALLRFAEARARGWSVPELRLYTNALMERNIALYLAAGYRETGRRPHPLRAGFMVVDMAKPVGSSPTR
jgi:ribosomal protein S18 acetylase RimI-like enzyme